MPWGEQTEGVQKYKRNYLSLESSSILMDFSSSTDLEALFRNLLQLCLFELMAGTQSSYFIIDTIYRESRSFSRPFVHLGNPSSSPLPHYLLIAVQQFVFCEKKVGWL